MKVYEICMVAISNVCLDCVCVCVYYMYNSALTNFLGVSYICGRSHLLTQHLHCFVDFHAPGECSGLELETAVSEGCSAIEKHNMHFSLLLISR